jgi:predicted aspartyl protease
MLEGRFGDTSGAPFLEGRIILHRLGISGLVSFLVDTGADATILTPTDGRKLGIDYDSLQNPETSAGIGGPARTFQEQAILSFSDRRYVYSYLIAVRILEPKPYNRQYNSLLGRDILRSGHFVMDSAKRRVTFTPYLWSLRQKIR